MQSIHRPSACPAQRAIEKLFRKQYKGTVTPNWNRLPETPSELEDTTCIYFPLSHIDVAENGCAVTRGGAIPPPSVSLDASLLRKYGELPHRDDGNAAEHVQKAETAAKQTLKVAVRVNNLSMQDLSADQIAMLKTAYRDAFLHCLHFKQWYGAHAGLQTETADATIVTCWLPIPDGIDIIDATHGLRSCVSAGELVEITLQLVPYTSAIKGNLSSELLTVDVTNGPEMQDSRPWASFFFVSRPSNWILPICLAFVVAIAVKSCGGCSLCYSCCCSLCCRSRKRSMEMEAQEEGFPSLDIFLLQVWDLGESEEGESSESEDDGEPSHRPPWRP